MSNEEARQVLIGKINELESRIYTTSSLQEIDALNIAVSAIDKQMTTAEMNIAYTKEFPHHITLKIDYSDLINTDENKFIEDLQRCVIQLYERAKTDWSGDND